MRYPLPTSIKLSSRLGLHSIHHNWITPYQFANGQLPVCMGGGIVSLAPPHLPLQTRQSRLATTKLPLQTPHSKLTTPNSQLQTRHSKLATPNLPLQTHHFKLATPYSPIHPFEACHDQITQARGEGHWSTSSRHVTPPSAPAPHGKQE